MFLNSWPLKFYHTEFLCIINTQRNVRGHRKSSFIYLSISNLHCSCVLKTYKCKTGFITYFFRIVCRNIQCQQLFLHLSLVTGVKTSMKGRFTFHFLFPDTIQTASLLEVSKGKVEIRDPLPSFFSGGLSSSTAASVRCQH